MIKKDTKSRSDTGVHPAPLFKKKSGAGFTLVELVVAFVIFVIIIGAAFNVLVSGIAAQRELLAQQILVDQVSFFVEYMNRALRQAKKDVAQTCLSVAGVNYEITHGGKGVKFIGRDDRCREFFLDGDRIKEDIDGIAGFLTGDDIEVVDVTFVDSIPGGSFSQIDNNQPRITFTFDVRPRGFESDEQPSIRLQTSISQRNIDIRE